MQKPIYKRKAFRLLALLIGLFLALHVVLYFSADWLLRGYLQRKVTELSEGKYALEFDRFYISFLERGVGFRELEIKPLLSKEEMKALESDLPLFRVSLKHISLKGLFYQFLSKEFRIGTLRVESPELDFALNDFKEDLLDGLEEDAASASSESPLQLLEQELQKTFLRSVLEEIRIVNLYIQDGDLLLENFIAQRSMKAEKTNIYLKNMRLLQERDPATPLNAEGFEIELSRFELLLADSVHTIFADNVNISSLESFIRAKALRVRPNFEKESKTYLALGFNQLSITEADINRVFYTSEVIIGDLLLHQPEVHVYSASGSSGSSTASLEEAPVDADNLYPLVEGILKEIRIEKLRIQEGTFSQALVEERERKRVEINRLDLQMDAVYIGPESNTLDQFFFAAEAAMELYDVTIRLNDRLHDIRAEFARLDSKEDIVRVEKFTIRPNPGSGGDSDSTLLAVNLPEFSVEKANLKKVYNEGIFDVQKLLIVKPEFDIKDLSRKQESSSGLDLRELTKDFLQAIYIEEFEIQEGALTVDNRSLQEQDSLSFGRFNLRLEAFQLDEETENSPDAGIFYAQHLALELSDYALKLADNVHLFRADHLRLDTKTKEVSIDNFRISALDSANLQETLRDQKKTTGLAIHVPQFKAYGADLKRAYFNKELLIQKIEVPAPEIAITKFFAAQAEETDSSELPVDEEKADIVALLSSYFNRVAVRELLISSGSLSFENKVGENMKTFSEDKVNIRIQGFEVRPDTDSKELSNLFSEEVDIRLNEYVFDLADGRYAITVDAINFNSQREEITSQNVRLRPNTSFKSNFKISAVAPSLSFTGVDLESFLFDSELLLNKIKLSDATVTLLFNNDVDGEKESNNDSGERRDRNLPKALTTIRIDTVMAERARIEVDLIEEGVRKQIINTAVFFQIDGFKLDPDRLEQGQIANFFDDIQLTVDAFRLDLADEMHQVTFESVSFDTRYEGVLMKNLEITPKHDQPKPGQPLIEGAIQSLLVKTNQLKELQRSKRLELKEVSLFKPTLALRLDPENPMVIEKNLFGIERTNKNEDEKAPFLEVVHIDRLRVEEADFDLQRQSGNSTGQNLRSLNLSLDDLTFDLRKQAERVSLHTLINKNFDITLSDYRFNLPDSLNQVRLGYLTFSNERIMLEDISLVPRYGPFAYTRKKGHQVDVMELHIPRMTLHEPDLETSLSEGGLFGRFLQVEEVDFRIFKDKRAPELEKVKEMPQALMRQMPFLVRIDSIALENALISYTEFPKNGLVPGTITFQRLDATLGPIHMGDTEDFPFLLEKTNLQAQAYLNGQAKIRLEGLMRYEAPYPMTLHARADSFDLATINSILEPNAFARVRKGSFNGASWKFTADQFDARGSMKLYYKNLNLALLDERTLEEARGRKGVLTFVINVLAVRSNNPRKIFGNTVSARIYAENPTDKFIFNYWWRATLSGVKGSLGLGQPKIPKRKEEEPTTDPERIPKKEED
ncbi:MAG: hypothetical protein ACXIT9_12820 [Nitritalea sp.]